MRAHCTVLEIPSTQINQSNFKFICAPFSTEIIDICAIPTQIKHNKEKISKIKRNYLFVLSQSDGIKETTNNNCVKNNYIFDDIKPIKFNLRKILSYRIWELRFIRCAFELLGCVLLLSVSVHKKKIFLASCQSPNYCFVSCEMTRETARWIFIYYYLVSAAVREWWDALSMAAFFGQTLPAGWSHPLSAHLIIQALSAACVYWVISYIRHTKSD